MHVEIREAAPRKAICMAHHGPYFMIGGAFQQLGQWLAENGVEHGEGIALYYDDPSATPPNELRSDAGAFVSENFTTDDARVHLVEVPGGVFAVGTHCGPYDGLPKAWGELAGTWLPQSGRTLRRAPSFEVYLNDCTKVSPEELRTELYAPIDGPAGD